MKKIASLIICLILLAGNIHFAAVPANAANASSTAGQVKTQSTALNVRQSASTSSAVLKTLKNKSWVTIISKSGSFYKVEYAAGKYGYCHQDYISKKSSSYAAYVNTVSGNLNVRKGAGSNYEIAHTLSKGTVVVVISTSGSWSRIIYNGTKTGYVSSAYLSKSKPASTYKAISLTVPSFKQTDSRWSNVKLGSSSDTIGKSGCTTTCLAMTESFRTGTQINPAVMASKLSYSSSGMLYWPSNYNTQLVTESNWLSAIYTALSQSKPAIFGAKKSNGSQHWVVVTGHTASASSLKASNFKINDPGSSTRKTLADFIADYPVPYKVAVYK